MTADVEECFNQILKKRNPSKIEPVVDEKRGFLYFNKAEVIDVNKRYQVFVSSTFEDLQEERKRVIQVLLESDCIPAGMELFPASNEEQWSLIQDVIDDCDYYLLIIGGRYGSTNNEGKSYTQMEYEYAKKMGKPIIAFIHKNLDKIPSGKVEKTTEGKDALNEFKNTVQGYLVKYWETPNELAAEVVISLHKLINKFPAVGWIKSDSVVDEISIKEIRRLQTENRYLKQKLDKLSRSAPDGAENLQQGNDEFSLSFARLGKYGSLSVTWNQLYTVVAPYLIDRGSEQQITEAIEELIARIIEKSPIEAHAKCWLSKESLGTILVQFKALGLIQLSEHINTPNEQETYWQLTPYGDLVMTQLVAKRK